MCATIFFACTATVSAQGRIAAPETTTVALMQRFVNAAYPELRGRHLDFEVFIQGDFDQDWTVPGLGLALNVREPTMCCVGGVVGEPIQQTDRAREKFLSGLFDVSVSLGRVSNARFSGEYVNSGRNRDLEHLVKANPNWSEKELESAMAKAGAKFPPSAREEFLAAVNVQRFTPLFGSIQIVNVELRWRQTEVVTGKDDVFAPTWSVIVRAGRGSGTPVCLFLDFEPFDGRLQSSHVSECE